MMRLNDPWVVGSRRDRDRFDRHHSKSQITIQVLDRLVVLISWIRRCLLSWKMSGHLRLKFIERVTCVQWTCRSEFTGQ